MFYLVTIGGCILSILGGSSARSYTIGNGRTQDYSGTYSAGGFIGLKDVHDLPDHRYGSSLSSGSGSSSGHSTYSDGQGGGYLGHSGSTGASSSGTSNSGTSTSSTSSINNSTPDILNSISSDSVSDMSTGYTSGASSLEYNSPSSHGSVNFAGYAGSQQSSNDHSSLDYAPSSSSSTSSSSSPYSSSSSPYSSSSTHQNSYSGGKMSPYTSGSSSSHAASPYSSSNYHGHSNSYPSASLSSSYPGSSYSGSFPSNRYTSSSFPASHSGPNSHPESLRFTSTAALNNYLSTLHGNIPNYSHNSVGNHHGPNYIHAASSNVVPSYSKSSSGYFQGGTFPKGSSKIIIIKDGHGNTGGMMHSEHPGFSTNIYGSGSNYKVRSAGPFSSGYTNNYGPSSGYSGGHYSAPSTLGSLFGF